MSFRDPLPPVLSDLEIARETDPEPVEAIGAKLGLSDDDLEHHGDHVAKLTAGAVASNLEADPDGTLVVLMLTMPGLPREPSALEIGLDDDGTVHGLF